jgi:hypothetical protein
LHSGKGKAHLVLALALTDDAADSAVVTVESSFGVMDPALEMPDEEVELMLLFRLSFEYLGTNGRSSINILYWQND